MNHRFLILLLAGLIPAGCADREQIVPVKDQGGTRHEVVVQPVEEDDHGPPIVALVLPQDKVLSTLVEGNNQFAVNLYRRLGKKPGNKFFSPYSVSAALGMTYAGAKGETAQEMARTLRFALVDEQLHPAFGKLIREIQGTDKKRDFQLATANSLWANNRDFHINANFLRITQTDYQAGIQLVDFIDNSEGARNKINGWVEVRTNNKIKELFRDPLSTRTRLILVNAIYFKGKWVVPFPKGATRSDRFAVPGSPSADVPMMNLTFRVGHFGNDDFQIAEIPYQGNEVSMVIILPRKTDGLAEIEKKLSPSKILEALKQAWPTDVKMSLPRFKMTQKFSLPDELKVLGMNKAFIKGTADFTGMENGRPVEESLFISDVVHKAFVEVEEEGTEAAAATAVIVWTPASLNYQPPPPPIPFRADHPFLFLIRHNPTGSILFMGRVHDPRTDD